MTTIQAMSMAEFWTREEVPGMLAAYEVECCTAGLPATNPDRTMYAALEAAGALHLLVALQDQEMIGFVSVILSPVARYGGAKLAVTESLYVAPQHRLGRTGIELLRRGEALAFEAGAIGFFVSAPVDGALHKMLATGVGGYRQSNVIYFKGPACPPS